MKEKLTLILMTICLLVANTQAQTSDEWFRQKQTRKKYLAKQVVLLQTYLGYLKKGYLIADQGLTTVQNIKNGNFTLHRDFFASLGNVNPKISTFAKVTDVTSLQVRIIQNMKRVNDYCHSNSQFTIDEAKYVSNVYSNMLFACDNSLSELLAVTNNQDFKMQDDERLSRIDKLYEDVCDQFAFVKSFEDDVHTIADERVDDKRSRDELAKLHDVL